LLNDPVNLAIDAPCKVNLNLSIGERRPDAFHSIESIFAAFTLCDTLKFEVRGKTGAYDDEIRLSAGELPPVFRETLSPSSLPPEKNLVHRAVKLFKRESDFDRAVSVQIDKRIPPAAGLGGGSSDAAAALLAMNRLSGEAVEHQKLMSMAAELGSDVPFFVEIAAPHRLGQRFCSAAFVSGRGECIELAAAPLLDIVIVNPGMKSSTKEAFALLDKFRTAKKNKPSNDMPPKSRSKADLLAALEKNPAEWPFTNDFLAVFLEASPQKNVYRAILRDLAHHKALFSGISGSGASCFGIFPCADAAKSAASQLSALWPFVQAVHNFNAAQQ
jgi:4-diphosphocytidyl-2-C-methyl-D-erythritol kinase